jgi:FAD/FMN-containing dehydrogenase
VGSINFGGLRDFGNVMRLRVATMEAEPRLIDLTGEDLHKVTHAYGTNGIITEVEMPLTSAYDWVDVIVGFGSFMDAARYGNALACQDGLLTKLITPLASPVPQLYFKRHAKFLAEGMSVCVCMVAPQSLDAFLAFTRRAGGMIAYNAVELSAEERKGLPPAYELAWNHTTLRALRVDPSITYLQSLYPFPNQLALVEKMDGMFPGEVFSHLEFVRLDGAITCFGLNLVKFTTEERLDEIIRVFEENGCPIFNPHRYTLEEGGMKQTDAVQLAFKREADPQGLLNPGKMIAWENPDYDYRSGRTFLFKGLERAAG